MEVGVPRLVDITSFFAPLLVLSLAACRPAPSSPRPTNAPAPAPAPAQAQEKITPETLRFVGDDLHGAPGIPQILSRSPKRMYLAMPTMRQAWLFVQDPQDPARFEGYLILHRRRAIVHYPQQDLEIEGIARSWSELGQTRGAKVQSRQDGVDPELLKDPQSRYSKYRFWRLKDWRHATHNPTGHHHGPGQNQDHTHDEASAH